MRTAVLMLLAAAAGAPRAQAGDDDRSRGWRFVTGLSISAR